MPIPIGPIQYDEIAFNLNQRQLDLLNAWLREVTQRARDIQAASKGSEHQNLRAYVDYGAIGGGITFSFTPTSLGIICMAKEAITGEEIDLSEYENW